MFATFDGWLEGLWNSHTGRRLREMLPEDIDFEVVNSIARVGRKSASKFTPDLAHVAEMIGTYHPRLVLACGQAAQQVVERLGVACCPAPHPAWRRLSKQQTADIRGQLARLLA